MLSLDMQPANLVTLARDVATELNTRVRQERIRVETALAELPGTWDAFRLERVFSDLLSNAVKYSPPGSAIVVTVAREEPRWAVLVVQDEGVGIPETDLPFIFDRFYRAGNVDHTQGRGIGLAVVRQIVEQHRRTWRCIVPSGRGPRSRCAYRSRSIEPRLRRRRLARPAGVHIRRRCRSGMMAYTG